MTATTPSQPEITESGKDDIEKEIVVAEQERNDQPIPYVDEKNDEQPIPNASDQSETSEYEGFHDLGFMAHTTIPLSVVYPNSYFEVEIPHVTNKYIHSDDDKLNPRNGRIPSHGEQIPLMLEVLQPLVVPKSSSSKKSKLTVNMKELVEKWEMTIEEVREIMLEHNSTARTRKEDHRSIKFSRVLHQLMLKRPIFSVSILTWPNETKSLG